VATCKALVIVDLDGVVADDTKRMNLAREVYLAKCREEGKEPVPLTRQKGFDWETYLDPGSLTFDTLIEDADHAIWALDKLGWCVVFLTGRIHTMRAATRVWLRRECLSFYDLYTRDEEEQFTPGEVWKPNIVQYLIEVYQATEVLIVDDQECILNAIAQVLTIPFRVHTSLADAVHLEERIRSIGKET